MWKQDQQRKQALRGFGCKHTLWPLSGAERNVQALLQTAIFSLQSYCLLLDCLLCNPFAAVGHLHSPDSGSGPMLLQSLASLLLAAVGTRSGRHPELIPMCRPFSAKLGLQSCCLLLHSLLCSPFAAAGHLHSTESAFGPSWSAAVSIGSALACGCENALWQQARA